MVPDFSFSAAGIALGFLISGIVVAWVAGKFLKTIDGAGLMALLLLPFISYLIFAGHVENFKGAGIEARFREIARKPILSTSLLQKDDFLKAIYVEDDIVRFAIFGIPQEILIVDATKWPQLSHYDRLNAALKIGELIYSSLYNGSFKSLIVVDQDRKPIGVFEREYFLDLIRIPFLLYQVAASEASHAASKEDLRAMIQQTELWIILGHPAQRAQIAGKQSFISDSVNLIDAFLQMTSQDWQCAAIVDSTGRLSGAIWRQNIADKLLVSILSDLQN